MDNGGVDMNTPNIIYTTTLNKESYMILIRDGLASTVYGFDKIDTVMINLDPESIKTRELTQDHGPVTIRVQVQVVLGLKESKTIIPPEFPVGIYDETKSVEEITKMIEDARRDAGEVIGSVNPLQFSNIGTGFITSTVIIPVNILYTFGTVNQTALLSVLNAKNVKCSEKSHAKYLNSIIDDLKENPDILTAVTRDGEIDITLTPSQVLKYAVIGECVELIINDEVDFITREL